MGTRENTASRLDYRNPDRSYDHDHRQKSERRKPKTSPRGGKCAYPPENVQQQITQPRFRRGLHGLNICLTEPAVFDLLARQQLRGIDASPPLRSTKAPESRFVKADHERLGPAITHLLTEIGASGRASSVPDEGGRLKGQFITRLTNPPTKVDVVSGGMESDVKATYPVKGPLRTAKLQPGRHSARTSSSSTCEAPPGATAKAASLQLSGGGGMFGPPTQALSG